MKNDSMEAHPECANAPCLLVAEIGINHNGDMDLAETMVLAAKEAGADAVKFQNYQTEDFVSDHSLTYKYTSQGKEIEEPQFSMFKRCELSDGDLRRIKRFCDDQGVMFFSTPTSSAGVDILREIGSSHIKNGSDFLGHLPLIRQMARSEVPTVLSTGMATESEIGEACDAFHEAGGKDLMLLVCTSAYPTTPDSVHLRKIPEMAGKFGCPVGFSDHTDGWKAAVGAVALGARMIEKHFTSDRNLPGPDQWFSSDPAEFAKLVRRVREMEVMLGSREIGPTPAEEHGRMEYRLSCVANGDLPAGHVLGESDIAYRRPAHGLPPSKVDELLGQPLLISVKYGEPLTHKHVNLAL